MNPAENQVVSVLSTVDLMFSEELNNPQPSDFIFSGAASITVNAVQKINTYTYRLILTQNSLSSGTITLSFAGLKDYNGNAIQGPTSVTYIGNVDVPVTIPTIDPSGSAIQNPSHYGVSSLNNAPAGTGGYDAIDVYWYYSYVPEKSAPTNYAIKRTNGSTDCKDPSAFSITSWAVLPNPAVGAVATYDNTNVTTKTNTTNKFTLKSSEFPAPGNYTILICIDNDVNNKHGTGVLNVVSDNSQPASTLTPFAPAYPLTAASASAKTLTFTCSDNSDRILYTSVPTIGTGVVPTLLSVPDPAFDPVTGVIITGTLYDPNNKPVTPYGGNLSDNPTITTYKYRCIDKAGNIEALATMKNATFEIDSSLPSVTLAHVYKTGTTQAITGVSPSGYTSADFIWSTNQVNKYWEIRRNGTACGSGGTVVASTTTTGLTTPSPADTQVTTAITPASPGIAAGDNTLLFCVGNNAVLGSVTKWGQESFVLLSATSLALPQVNIAAGNFGVQQNLVFSCDPTTTDKIAYIETTQAGAAAPTPSVANPDFTPTGNVDTTIIGNTPFTAPIRTPDASTTVYKVACIDRAGNRSAVLTTGDYHVDTILPTISIASNSRDALSNTAGYTATTINWRSSRGGLQYHVKQPGTACGAADLSSGTNISGITPANVSQSVSTTINVASFTAETTYDIQICVQNFVGQWGYTSYTLRKDITPPNIIAANLTPAITAGAGNSYTLSWNAADDTGGSGVVVYRIFRDTATTPTFPGYPNTPEYSVAATAGLNSAMISMPDASKYSLRIVPVDAAGNVTALAASYNVIATRLNLIVNVTGYTAGSGDFRVQQGGDTLAFNATPGGTQTFATGFTPGSSYKVSVTAQPTNQICSFIPKQFGTITNDLTLQVQCLQGQWVGGNYQATPPVPLNYLLYRGKVTTLAGNGAAGFADNTSGISAQFQNPEFMIHLNSALYIADSNNKRIRKMDLGGSNAVTTIAGTLSPGPPPAAAGDTTDDNTDCTLARFGVMTGIATDGVNLYTGEYSPARRIRKISNIAGTCSVTTLAGAGPYGYADGPAATAQFSDIYGLVSDGKNLYVSENGNNRIRKIDLATGIVSTIAGNGVAASVDSATGTSASFNSSTGMTVIGTDLYLGDVCWTCAGNNGNTIRKISLLAPHPVTTVAGVGGTAALADGPGNTAKFYTPIALTTDGTSIFVADLNNSVIRRIDPNNGYRVSTLAGSGALGNTDGIGAAAVINRPHGVATDGRRLYFSEWGGHRIKKIDDTGLVGYWPINPGVNPNDYSSDNGTPASSAVVNGPLSTTVDRFNTANAASLFNGTNQYVSAGSGGLPTDLDQPVTLAAWVNLTDLSQDSAIMGTASFRFRFNVGANGSVYFQNWHSSGGGTKNLVTTSTGLIAANTWTHIAYVRSSGTSAFPGGRIFINGHDMTASSSSAGPASDAINVPLTIGYSTASLTQTYMKGSLTGVRIYSRALNEGEINELSQDALQSQVGTSFNAGGTGLVMHYTLANSIAAQGPAGGGLSLAGNPASMINGKDGNTNGAFYYDGGGYHYTNSYAGLPTGNAPRTHCGWVRPANKIATGQYFTLLQYGLNGTNQKAGLWLRDNGGVKKLVNGGGGNDHEADFDFPINTWTHVCNTYDGTNSALYANGRLLGTAAFPAWNTQQGALGLGRDLPTTGFLTGGLADIRIYNNALTASQIRQLATQVPEGLVLHLDMNGDATDTSGFAQTLVSNSGSLSSGRYGIANTAYRFTTGQSAQFAHSNTLGNMQDLTVSFWMQSPDLDSTLGSELVTKYNSCIADGWTVKYDNATFFQAQCGGGVTLSSRVRAKNVWMHYTYVRTGTTGRKLYINGADLTSATGTLTALVANTVPLRIAGGTGDKTLQDIRIYNRALAPSEVRALSGYHALNSGTPVSLHAQADTFSNLTDGVAITTNWTDSASPTPYNSAGGIVTGPPRFVSGASSLLGGRPAVEFDGTTGKYFNFGAASLTYSGLTVCAAATRKGNGYYGLVEKRVTVGSDTNSWGMITNSAFNQMKFEMGAPPVTSVIDTVTDDTPAIYCMVSGGSNRIQTFVNGQVASTSAGTVISGSNTAALLVGARFDLVGSYYGQIGEVLVHTSGASSAERLISECYLSAKYSIPLQGTPTPPICP